MQKVQFDYFYGMEAEQYSFYRVPKVLFTAERFRTLSCEAKILYGLMLDRMSLSIRNRWLDEEDRVYIIFTVEEIMELLGCARQKAIKNIAELDTEKGIGLIEKKRLGLGKPNVIYVKNFIIRDCPEPEQREKQPENTGNTQKYENQTSRSMKSGLQEVPESNFQKYENQTSGSMKTEFQEVPKSNCNNTDINNTDINNTEYSETENILSNPILSAEVEECPDGMDVIEKMDAYRDIIREHIDYRYHADEDVDELVELMTEVMMMPDDSTLRIAGADKPAALVKSRFMKLDYSHIEYVRFCLRTNTTRVGNIKAYLLTTLYNAALTMNYYYRAEVYHSMYGSG
ncbi:hypothetical protein BRYFOR_05479 [Marvinbryantia formatexigens DSM 14469]|uniref:Uncharacterized protein n=1 Tax=Marvinbryantia formatexigens DSM 14469 TaxID=478749 RepID=C6LA37_9FIRM|nr:DUF6017 domain-containing protein [Marvinbryantia formatexigens]EET62444.1 hypothetical protein BRYFOR_05479 [Marvinbryantia formatexigens DSM 14469]UWO25016.1 replication initiator protein A [Marvinbryantia formatexigens DSM 14469]SDG27568.1 Replication initiator protein A (RepA) N-terminus [Marvinbryantia formatexigens]